MTELELVYGLNDNQSHPQDYKKQKNNQHNEENHETEYKIPETLYQNQQQQQQIQERQQQQYPMMQNQERQQRRLYEPSYSFWDRLTLKQNDVYKLAIFSFVILYAIALDRFFTYYITSYLSDNNLSFIQELLIRISYPILILLLIWILKAL